MNSLRLAGGGKVDVAIPLRCLCLRVIDNSGSSKPLECVKDFVQIQCCSFGCQTLDKERGCLRRVI